MIGIIRYAALALLATLYLGSTVAGMVGGISCPCVGTGTQAFDLSSGPRPDQPRPVYFPRRHIPLKGEISCSPAPCVMVPSPSVPDDPSFSTFPVVAPESPVALTHSILQDRAPPDA
jgi:hypothetical protein